MHTPHLKSIPYVKPVICQDPVRKGYADTLTGQWLTSVSALFRKWTPPFDAKAVSERYAEEHPEKTAAEWRDKWDEDARYGTEYHDTLRWLFTRIRQYTDRWDHLELPPYDGAGPGFDKDPRHMFQCLMDLLTSDYINQHMGIKRMLPHEMPPMLKRVMRGESPNDPLEAERLYKVAHAVLAFNTPGYLPGDSAIIRRKDAAVLMPGRMIGDTAIKLAATADLLQGLTCCTTTDSEPGSPPKPRVNDFAIWDFKTGGDVSDKNHSGKMMTGPLAHLAHCKRNDYALQLSAYRYIIERSGAKVEACLLCHVPQMKPEQTVAPMTVMLMPYLRDEVEACIIEHLK